MCLCHAGSEQSLRRALGLLSLHWARPRANVPWRCKEQSHAVLTWSKKAPESCLGIMVALALGVIRFPTQRLHLPHACPVRGAFSSSRPPCLSRSCSDTPSGVLLGFCQAHFLPSPTAHLSCSWHTLLPPRRPWSGLQSASARSLLSPNSASDPSSRK